MKNSKRIHVGVSALNQTPLDWEKNKFNILTAIDTARAEGVSILCLPELCISGYGCEDAFLCEWVYETSLEILAELVPYTKNILVAIGLPVAFEGSRYSAAALVGNKQIFGIAAKQFLACNGIHYECRWFRPWPANRKEKIKIGKSFYPFGDCVFACGGIGIGFEICEDAWVKNRPAKALSERGVRLILNPSASHFALGKLELRKRFILEATQKFKTSYLYANLMGNEAGRAIYDGGGMIASQGEIKVIGKRLSYSDSDLTSAIIEVEKSETTKAIDVGFVFPKNPKIPKKQPQLSWEKSPYLREEEFTRAVALGLFDYLRKSGSHSFIVSLSGGADSSLTASLVALSIVMGVKELGFQKFVSKLGLDLSDEKTLTRALLTCVYQATKNSSDKTKTSAEKLAHALGATFYCWDIDREIKFYQEMVEKSLSQELTWKKNNTALQNIQARVRAPGIWLLANVKNALLLSTCNRSESSVGYATMDGDTAGGLSPLGGIQKSFIRKYLLWLEKKGPQGCFSVPALSLVNHLEPTAELKPKEFHQTDESDLMPYVVLDAIERAFVRDKKSPQQVLNLITKEFSKYSRKQLKEWTIRFFKLWAQSQWKRERFAPSFHLDDESVDPKTWCRFPILSGGFRYELDKLK